jgi:uncharacterized protein YbjQ (UPF0145 family)
MDLVELRSLYDNLSLKELNNLRENAVLSKEVEGVLMQAIAKKTKKGIDTGDVVKESKKRQSREKYDNELNAKLKEAILKKDLSGLDRSELKYLTRRVILTTESSPTDIKIRKRIDIVTAEYVYGMNMFRDYFSNMADVTGGRSRASQKILRDTRKVCLYELKKEALLVGADAVVGINLEYSEISGAENNGMLFLVASGTAVSLA